ncbi:possible lipopolysaccharide 1,2-glucosyltransferase WaaJ [Rickettsia typhi str. Wilmington]|uniref:Possible lipopolysaccharide 1,2-glucosyltransferase WaaJ n=3 Tax=Rickettsia typhi TaxID=785 RepID=Q68WQ4_RICTY|nr:possible lipopolysaccharide 1,2-glucosyltransferase WaaJ [Rickettsia typhi str. Wilmington]AFE54319.1 lipopolysaccharide 1,2-glucosyltransferase WaaJ [Rickettsia typhi str. TH1527]AFE55159.1 lipopolysaccharide 1,2-glucosyltransferase WaaJ [Rickettsia typhi str. B9991CWPP]
MPSTNLILFFFIFLMVIVISTFFISNYRMHKNTNCIMDIGTYSYKKFYSTIREDQLNLDLVLERLEDIESLNAKDKARLEKICSFQVEDGMVRLDVAKGYDCLLRFALDKNANLVQQYKAIKNGSYSLDTLYTKKAAFNLAKLIILGYKEKVKEIFALKNDDDLLKYYSGYTEDEVPFLNSLISLNIPELTARCLYRLSLIHVLGRSSFNEKTIRTDYKRAIKEIQNVIKLTGIRQNNILDIALTINDRYAIHAGAVIASSLLNSDLDSFYRFHIVMDSNDPISQESINKLSSMKYIRDYSIDFTTFPDNILNKILTYKKIKFADNWPSLVMYRLYFDKVFPNLDSILYLDADIVVLRDLNSLKKIDMNDYVAACSLDTAITYCIHKVQEDCKRNVAHSYKNSGIVFLNLKNMREKQYNNMLLETLKNSKCDFSLPDQDLLNVAFQNYLYPLSMRWNFCTYFEHQSPYFSYFILHYAGPKPWTIEKEELWKTNHDKLDKITQYYWQYREITPWSSIN